MRVYRGLFLLLLAQNIWAIGPATDVDKAEISSQLGLAALIQKGQDGIDEKQQYLRVNRYALNSEKIAEKQREIDGLKKQRDLYRDRAIHLTLRAYGIVPTNQSTDAISMPKGRVVMNGPWKGKAAAWIVVAGENSMRTAQDGTGSPIEMPIHKRKDGSYPIAFTDQDGVTTVLEESFTTPGLLALTLLHEQTHFKQFTTAGVGNKITQAEGEVSALQAEQGAMNLIGLTPAELNSEVAYLGDPRTGSKGELDKWKQTVETERHSRKPLAWPWSDEKEGPELPAHTTIQVTEIAKRFDDLDKIVASEVKFAREAAQKQAANEKLREKLAMIAVKACVGGIIGQEELDSLPAQSGNSLLSGKMPDSMSGGECEQKIFMSLVIDLVKGRRPTMNEIQSMAGERAQNENSLRESAREIDERAARRAQDEAIALASSRRAPQIAAAAAPGCVQTNGIGDLVDLAVSACDERPYLSDAGLLAAERYQAYGFQNCGDDAVGRSARASEQLSGCAKGVFDRAVSMLRYRPHFASTQELVDLINGFRRDQPAPSSPRGTEPNTTGGGRQVDARTSQPVPVNNNDAWNQRMKEIDERTKESLDRLYAQAKADFERRKREQEEAQRIQRGGTGGTENK